jgi:hypothetical protein
MVFCLTGVLVAAPCSRRLERSSRPHANAVSDL